MRLHNKPVEHYAAKRREVHRRRWHWHMKNRRNRLHYAILTAIVIVAGCAARSDLSQSWPPFLVKYSGDTLWALMLFLGLGCVFPSLSTARVTAIALLYAFGVEFSQLYRAAWIDSFRETLVGAVTIGSEFLWSDFACYVVGCGIAAISEAAGQVLYNRRRQLADRPVLSDSAPDGVASDKPAS